MQLKFQSFKYLCVSTLISLVFCSYEASNVEDDCSPRCWNPVQPNSNVYGGIKQSVVTNEEDCKALCVSNGTCIGVDWNTQWNNCWFQIGEARINNHERINHWSLASNTSGDCAPYCWRPVRMNIYVVGGIRQPYITTENHCKLLCSKNPRCIGINWSPVCYFLYKEGPLTSSLIDRHWSIKRNIPESASPAVSFTSNTDLSVQSSTKYFEALQSSTEPLEDIQNATEHLGDLQSSKEPLENLNSSMELLRDLHSSKEPLEDLHSSTEHLEDRKTEHSSNLISGVTVFAVLLGLCIFLIIGLVMKTLRSRRKRRQKNYVEHLELIDNFE